MWSVMSTGVLVNSDTRSCDLKISSVSTFMLLSFCARGFEFLGWCSVVPRRGLIISTRACERLYVTDPILSAMERSGVSFL